MTEADRAKARTLCEHNHASPRGCDECWERSVIYRHKAGLLGHACYHCDAIAAALAQARAEGDEEGRQACMRAYHVTLDTLGAPPAPWPCNRVKALAEERGRREALVVELEEPIRECEDALTLDGAEAQRAQYGGRCEGVRPAERLRALAVGIRVSRRSEREAGRAEDEERGRREERRACWDEAFLEFFSSILTSESANAAVAQIRDRIAARGPMEPPLSEPRPGASPSGPPEPGRS